MELVGSQAKSEPRLFYHKIFTLCIEISNIDFVPALIPIISILKQFNSNIWFIIKINLACLIIESLG